MKSMIAVCAVLLAVFLSEISAAQNPTLATKTFCPQCGFENKAAARFCPQCGTALPKLPPVLLPLSFPTPTAVANADTIDSTASARQELIRALMADPEFTRLLQRQIQSTTPAGLAVQPKTSSAKPNPVRDFFTIIGGLTCTVVFLGLALTL
jgi:predicted amidophosphoribosyltransferase